MPFMQFMKYEYVCETHVVQEEI